MASDTEKQPLPWSRNAELSRSGIEYERDKLIELMVVPARSGLRRDLLNQRLNHVLFEIDQKWAETGFYEVAGEHLAIETENFLLGAAKVGVEQHSSVDMQHTRAA